MMQEKQHRPLLYEFFLLKKKHFSLYCSLLQARNLRAISLETSFSTKHFLWRLTCRVHPLSLCLTRTAFVQREFRLSSSISMMIFFRFKLIM